MSRSTLGSAVLLLSLIALIVVLNWVSAWWDDTFGPTSTGPRPTQVCDDVRTDCSR